MRRGAPGRRIVGNARPFPAIFGRRVTPPYYEIRIAGIVPPGALVDFEHLDAYDQPVETVVHGPLQDQSALHRLFDRLEILGVRVLEVRRLRDRGPPDE
jgi:hypothetical protein